METTNITPDVSKEDKEKILSEKMAAIRKKNEELRKRHEEIEADKKLADKYSASVQMEDVKPYVMKPHRPRPEKMYSASEQNFGNDDIPSGSAQDMPLLSRQRLPQNDGPPPDPTYRFLADPDRDGSENKEDDASKGEFGRRGGRGRDRREGGTEDYGRNRGNSEYSHRGRGGGGYDDNVRGGRGRYDDGGRNGGFEDKNRGTGRFDNRGRSRGGEDRGRGRGSNWRGGGRGQDRRYDNSETSYYNQYDGNEKGHYRGRGQRRSHSGRGQQRAYEQWKAERAVIDEARISRARSGDGEWKREWDMEKIEQENKNVEETVEYDPRYPRSKGEGFKLKDMVTENAMKKLEELSLDDEANSSNSQRRGGRRGNRRSRGGGRRGGIDRQLSDTLQISSRSNDNWREPNHSHKEQVQFEKDYASEERIHPSGFENERCSPISSSCDETLRECPVNMCPVRLTEMLFDPLDASLSHNIDESLIYKDSYLTLEATIAENNAPTLQNFSPVHHFEYENSINISNEDEGNIKIPNVNLSDTFSIEDHNLKFINEPCFNVEDAEIKDSHSNLQSSTIIPTLTLGQDNTSRKDKIPSISCEVEGENLSSEVVTFQCNNQEIPCDDQSIVMDWAQKIYFDSQDVEVATLMPILSPDLDSKNVPVLGIEPEAVASQLTDVADLTLTEDYINDDRKIFALYDSDVPAAINSCEIGNENESLENNSHSNIICKASLELDKFEESDSCSKSGIMTLKEVTDDKREILVLDNSNILDKINSSAKTANNDKSVDICNSNIVSVDNSDKLEKELPDLEPLIDVGSFLPITASIMPHDEKAFSTSFNSEDAATTEISDLGSDNLAFAVPESKSEAAVNRIEAFIENAASIIEDLDPKRLLNTKKKLLPSSATKGVPIRLAAKPALKTSRARPTVSVAKSSTVQVSKPVASKLPLTPKATIPKKNPLKASNTAVMTKSMQLKPSPLKNSVDLKSHKKCPSTNKMIPETLIKTKSGVKIVASINASLKSAVSTVSHDGDSKLVTNDLYQATSVYARDSRALLYDVPDKGLKGDLPQELEIQINDPIISTASNLSEDTTKINYEIQEIDITPTYCFEASKAEGVILKDACVDALNLSDNIVIEAVDLPIFKLEPAIVIDPDVSSMNTLSKLKDL